MNWRGEGAGLVLRSVIEAVHDAQLVEHAGAAGLRDAGLLESALARPLNLHRYGETDPYVRGLRIRNPRNQPFVDGNKRTALHAAYVFLCINGCHLVADEVSAASNMLALAAGEKTQAEFADLRERAKGEVLIGRVMPAICRAKDV